MVGASFSAPVQIALGPNQTPVQLLPGRYPGGKAAGAPGRAEVKLPLRAFVACSRVDITFILHPTDRFRPVLNSCSQSQFCKHCSSPNQKTRLSLCSHGKC